MQLTPKKLNIAIVSDAVYPYNFGGKEKRIYEISTRLAKKGYKVTIYCMKWWEERENQVVHEGVIYEAISPFYPLYSGKRRSIREAVLFALHSFKLLKKDFDIIDVDHMPHLVLFPVKIVCILKRKKMIATWNEVWGQKYWIKYLGIAGLLAYAIERFSVLMPNRIISISVHTTKNLTEKFHIKQQTITIPAGINFSYLKEIKSSKDKADIVYAGRLLKHKNVDKLIYSIVSLRKVNPKIKCLIIGNGPEEAHLKKLVTQLKLEKNVLFYSFLPKHSDLYSLVKASKVFVFPSSREGFGIVVVESHALGVPVITYNHEDNAAKDLIHENVNGYLFDDEKNKLDDVLKKVLKIKLNSNKIKQSAKKYDWENIAHQIEEVYLS